QEDFGRQWGGAAGGIDDGVQSELAQDAFPDGAVQDGDTQQTFQRVLRDLGEHALLELQQQPRHGEEDGGAGMEGTAIYLGYRVFFSEGIDTFLTDLNRARPTIFLSVPRLLLKFQQGVFAKIPEHRLERLLRIPILKRAVRKRVLRKLGLDTVINAACGAAPLPPEILTWYRKLGLNLAEGYGMTETLITHL